jgi:hypothetical protein
MLVRWVCLHQGHFFTFSSGTQLAKTVNFRNIINMLWSSVNTLDFSHHIRASLFALGQKKDANGAKASLEEKKDTHGASNSRDGSADWEMQEKTCLGGQQVALDLLLQLSHLRG